MATPQKENGYTPISNEILDNIHRIKLNGSQWKIVLCIWRYTYGFKRKSTDISETFISRYTGILRPNVNRELKVLFKMNVVYEATPPTFSSAREIGFNKDYETWACTTCQIVQQASEQTAGIESDTTTGIESDTTTGIESDTQERKPKENLKKEGAHHKYGVYGWVRLTDRQYEKLIADVGEDIAEYYISYIDESAQQTGNKNKWKDWNLTIRKAINNRWGRPPDNQAQTVIEVEKGAFQIL